VLKNSPWEGRGFSHVRLSQRLTQDDENKGELIVEASLSCILAPPQKIGCPILRAVGEGWDKQKLRGRASGEEQSHPTLREQREGWGTRSFVGRARKTVFDCAANNRKYVGL
jgi:hypothetical protein